MQHDVACVRPETRLDEIVRLLRHIAVLDHEELVAVTSPSCPARSRSLPRDSSRRRRG
jgi:hypothetical protein